MNDHGIMRGDLTHVHLARSPGSRVGKRSHAAVLLAVAPERLRQAGYRGPGPALSPC